MPHRPPPAQNSKSISRRSMLRMVGGAAGASGLAGASLWAGSGLLSSTHAATLSRVRVSLDAGTYAPGDLMTLRVTEDLRSDRDVRVSDSSGLVWTRVSKTSTRQVWTARAAGAGRATVTAVALRADGTVIRGEGYRGQAGYEVLGPNQEPEPEPDPDPNPVTTSAMIGMSSPAHLWAQRVSEVGPGLAARRIFADLAGGASSQIDLVEQAHAAGMMPVISYKVGGNVAGAVNGQYNAVAEQAAAKLASYGLPTAVTFWHEPHGDMDPAQYVAASKQLLPIFKRGELRVGPLLNGWLLDRQQAAFASYCPDEMFGVWDWFGIDTYESGTMESPGEIKPADRIPAMVQHLSSRGFSLPLGVGEYNGYTAASIAAAGEALLSTPEIWFGCMWNATGGVGHALSGDRLAAFQHTLADRRCAKPRIP